MHICIKNKHITISWKTAKNSAQSVASSTSYLCRRKLIGYAINNVLLNFRKMLMSVQNEAEATAFIQYKKKAYRKMQVIIIG